EWWGSMLARECVEWCGVCGCWGDRARWVVSSCSCASLVAGGRGVAVGPECISTLSRPECVYRPRGEAAPEADVYVISRPNPGPVIAAFLEAAQGSPDNGIDAEVG
ncbi:type 2 periplasmic-binding domain-containing protein, partial [Sinorhizobium meliloti]